MVNVTLQILNTLQAFVLFWWFTEQLMGADEGELDEATGGDMQTTR